MYLKKLFLQQQDPSANYRPLTDEEVVLTEKEIKKAIDKAHAEKRALLNSINYQKSLSVKPVFFIPTQNQLYEALTNELHFTYKWDIDEYNIEQIKKLTFYYSNDPEFETLGEGYSLKKGNILFGSIGCGKTTLMNVLALNPFNPHRVISARTIAQAYAEMGNTAIKQYSAVQAVSPSEYFNHNQIGLCIDDMGTEQIKKNFGNELNVISEIILNRYDNLNSIGRTHVTTNISVDDMRAYYGDRAVSRMREMLNIIEFPFDGPDRRK